MEIINKWKRTCQECGASGYYAQPNLESKTDAWRDTKCRKCKSEALNFGVKVEVDASTGKELKADDEE